MGTRVVISVFGLVAAMNVPLQAQQPGPPSGAGVCTLDNPPARQEMEALLTEGDLAEVRQQTGLEEVSVSQVRVLEDPDDTPICARLQTRIPREYRVHGPKAQWKATFFDTGNRYVITVITALQPGEKPDLITWGQTIILNQDFDVLETVFN